MHVVYEKKLRFSTNIWFWHRSLLDRHVRSTLGRSSIVYSTSASTVSRYKQTRRATHQWILFTTDDAARILKYATYFAYLIHLIRNAFHCCHLKMHSIAAIGLIFTGRVTLCHSPFCIWFLYFESWQWICALSLLIAWTCFCSIRVIFSK